MPSFSPPVSSENSATIRARIFRTAVVAGGLADPPQGANKASAQVISRKDSRVTVYVIPTNEEELMIARHTLALISGRARSRRIIPLHNCSTACTPSADRFELNFSPDLSKTFGVGVLSARTSAVNSFSPASRASAARWRNKTAPIPCPW